MKNTTFTLIGGPTVLIEIGGLRLLTDPTFDPANNDYALGPVTLTKTASPAQTSASLGHIDAILLSHEQHSDNLDHAGRELAKSVPRIFTTPESALQVGENAIGLHPWKEAFLAAPDGRRLRITATPARHGPEGAAAFAGEVTGFLLQWEGENQGALYISGDTVWYEGVAAVAQMFDVGVALLNLGAARIAPVGPSDLTMNAEGAIEAARAFANAKIIPAHYEGWAHFSEPRAEVERQFASAGMSHRLNWLQPGVPTRIG